MIRTLNFDNQNIRTFTDEKGEIWFVVKDIFEVFNVPWAGTASVDFIRAEWKSVREFKNSAGVIQRFICVSEAGMYELAVMGDTPEIGKFNSWMLNTIMKSIRKDLAYIEDSNTPKLMIALRNLSSQTAEIKTMTNSSNITPPGVTPVVPTPSVKPETVIAQTTEKVMNDATNKVPDAVEALFNDRKRTLKSVRILTEIYKAGKDGILMSDLIKNLNEGTPYVATWIFDDMPVKKEGPHGKKKFIWTGAF